MGEHFYDPGPQRAAKVERLFAGIASRYDLINDLQSLFLHRIWKRRVLQLARPQPGEHALDVCCGTGDLALALARRQVEVIGLDFSQAMLQVAQKKAGSMKPGEYSLVQFVRGDALALPFSEHSFDIVTVGYGLRNLADWGRGLAEMHRVAQPGGRLLVLDFGRPANRVWCGLYEGYLRLFVPLLGLLFCGSADAYRYILESLEHYPAQQGVERRMNELGLANVQTVNLLGGAMSINYGEKQL